MKMSLFTRRSAFVPALLLALLPAAAFAAAPVIDSSSPQKLIETSSKALLADLDANRAQYRKDKAGLYKLIDTVFLPNVDVEYSAQLVLGKHWRTATPEQRKRFISAFYKSLLTTYGDALVDFTGNRMRIFPFQGDAAAARATVRTEIKRSNGAAVAVSFTLRKSDAGAWKVFDVVIEGISYVKSFQEDFGVKVDRDGIEGLLKQLETEGAAKPAAKG
jgi:phospholipid transport system substrate-binding protein